VIGIVSDTSYRSLREVPPPIFYLDPFGPDAYPDTFSLHVRTHGDPRSAIRPLRDLLHSIDPELPFFQVATLSEEVERSLWQERFLVALSSSFGIFALMLSSIGLYGILAFFVTGRRREIGLRLALGADRGHVIRLVAGRVVPLLVLGVLAGAGLAMLAGRWVGSLLYGVEPFDPWSASASLLLLVAIGIAAAAVPTIRALRVDPAATLRAD
jgi:ABC-type antimicrobial peptide transport system permease subunit